ncbi:LysM domain-containing protein [Ammoniphilus sp. YIM 78166]|uniref:LysM peptidoglycan-binding domain-containing protein n=1 Tax=Ammoniphilus sp. YIM 78166 TaxID=1644106 RepID=UPI0010705A7E|nr:LysM domain-containing protein [Ammoniphilus sp. YIM 78166]
MELRRVKKSPDERKDQEQEKMIVEVEDMEEEASAGSKIPPRSAIHGRKQKPTNPNRRGRVLALLLLPIFLCGAVWWYFGETIVNYEASSSPPSPALRLEKEEPSVDSIAPVQAETKPEVEEPTEPPAAQVEEKPTAPPAVPAPAKPAYDRITKHKVEVGETLYRISLRYYSTGKYADFLGRHNKLKQPSDLVSGTTIEVPFPPVR